VTVPSLKGETQWETYYFWNLAQRREVDSVDPDRRMFTLNRAFTPGMQRFPAVTWTGDMQDSLNLTLTLTLSISLSLSLKPYTFKSLNLKS